MTGADVPAAAQEAAFAAYHAHVQQPGSEGATWETWQAAWAAALEWAAQQELGKIAASAQRERAREIAQRAEEIHAEHHPGYITPSLDACTEHDRAEYEQRVASLLRQEGGGDG